MLHTITSSLIKVTNQILLKPSGNDVWFIDLPLLPSGRYKYKFYIDNSYWVEDVPNPWRIFDNHGGWNNVVEMKKINF